MKRHLLLLAGALSLTACTQTGAPGPTTPQGAIPYMCGSGHSIQVAHNLQDQDSMIPWPDDHIRLTIDGRDFEMYRVKAASGEKYATEQGLSPGAGLIWHAKGDEALLQAMILDHTVGPDHYPIITRCERLQNTATKSG